MIQRYYSHGKLLLTGEYVVLDGAKSLALPTKKGQVLEVAPLEQSNIKWQSILHDKSSWLDYNFDLPLTKNKKEQDAVLLRLQEILVEAKKMNPSILENGISFKSTLEFNKDWGLGSSSTLINNIAQWAAIDPYELLKNTFGGSGYDIACANSNTAISYQLINDTPEVTEVVFNPIFKESIFFVYLNRKQNSRESIQHYRSVAPESLQAAIQEISQITTALINCDSLSSFEELLETHERIIANLIKSPTVKEQLFPDYTKTIKSLGGWGGDFILATGSEKEKTYFKNKGYVTIIPFSEMIL